jgi:hypothetical protein
VAGSFARRQVYIAIALHCTRVEQRRKQEEEEEDGKEQGRSKWEKKKSMQRVATD